MKKLLCLISTCILAFSELFALPGTKSFIPDNSGDFVYYKDNSFNRESYIGILCYDDATFQIRYFAPGNKNEHLPEKEMKILLTINPNVNYWEMTGEKILSAIMPNSSEDIDLINYLHDILYDFSGKRNKIFSLAPDNENYILNKEFSRSGLCVQQDLPQFGGKVNIVFDNIIPLFNIKTIFDQKNNKIIEAICFGRLLNSNDQSFDNFKGFPSLQKFKAKKINTNKKPTTTDYCYNEHQSITLDSAWSQELENCWINNDSSIITISEIPQLSPADMENTILILRQLLKSSNQTFKNLTNLELKFLEENNKIRINCMNYTLGNEKPIINNILLTNCNQESNSKYFFSMSTYLKDYMENQTYYENIIKTYKIN